MVILSSYSMNSFHEMIASLEETSSQLTERVT